MNVYIVTVLDYEDSTIIGVYSTREKAQGVADATDVVQYGRFGPYVVAMELDRTTPFAFNGELPA